MNRLFISAFILLLATGGASWIIFGKKSPPPSSSLFELLSGDEILPLRLETDMVNLMTDKTSVESQPAVLTCHSGADDEMQFDIEVRLRGNTRKTICNFPPLKLKFNPETLDSLGLKPFTSLKLVTHCKSDSTFEQILFKEYLTYKMYASLTDNAFKVQLVEVEYVDDNDSLETIKHYGFIIENQKELADRLNATLVDEEAAPIKTIHQDHYKTFVMFQYMVGNTDWNLTNRHNIEVVIPEDNPSPVPVPYDFDFSGFVNAPYAKPYPTMPISSVRERLFQWRGKKDADFSMVAELFLSKKPEIMKVFDTFYQLGEKEKADMLYYIESFYEKLENANGNLTASYFMEQNEAN